ncbi:alpha-amylase family glycosyl hydrolase [Corallincola platygyrae]|uniref:Alpha-amylase family glycosyl hydrolase n=1 Tax=Corallincola platygyrae TaxID=1193278 RepID=A0ABW4XMS8_9GAMM
MAKSISANAQGVALFVVLAFQLFCCGASVAGQDSLLTESVSAINKGSELSPFWYQKGVFMEIYVRGYKDSDGDGIGDFNGLTSTLDYLSELGVKGIWLLPVMDSQDKDHGYAVKNYRQVESDYGTEEDFKRFLFEAHKRGIGVILDYVLNHSGSAHPAFKASKSPQSPYRDWYLWRDKYTYWPNWQNSPTWHQSGDEYYYGLFWKDMPDFNLRNAEVVSYHQSNLRYWLNLGVDGFRFDAVGTLLQNTNNGAFLQAESGALMEQAIMPVINEYDNRYVVCESTQSPLATADVCGSSFYFGLNSSILSSAKFGRVKPRLVRLAQESDSSKTATFLANHDSFTGGRLYEQFAGDLASYKTAVTTLLTLPGIPFIYYGDEIGMGHTLAPSDPDPDHRLRGPMSWNADHNSAGFSSKKAFRGLARNYSEFNVEVQMKERDSIFYHYKKLIELRNTNPALFMGSFRVLDHSNNKVLVFLRELENQKVLVAINYSDRGQHLSNKILGECWQVLDGPERDKRGTSVLLQPKEHVIYRSCTS